MFLLYSEPPHFVRPMRSEVAVSIGDSVVLQCLSSGAPMPSITWFKDGSIVVHSGHVVFAMSGQYLVIPEAEEEDSGSYACEATNSQGTVRQRTKLSVETGMLLAANTPLPNRHFESRANVVIARFLIRSEVLTPERVL